MIGWLALGLLEPGSSIMQTHTVSFIRLGGVIAVGVLFLTGGIACNSADDENFREDVLHCELAVAHVEECCPGLIVQAKACVYHHLFTTSDCACSGGSSTHEELTEPVLPLPASDNLMQTKCEDIALWDGCATLKERLNRNNSRVRDTSCGGSGNGSYDFRT